MPSNDEDMYSDIEPIRPRRPLADGNPTPPVHQGRVAPDADHDVSPMKVRSVQVVCRPMFMQEIEDLVYCSVNLSMLARRSGAPVLRARRRWVGAVTMLTCFRNQICRTCLFKSHYHKGSILIEHEDGLQRLLAETGCHDEDLTVGSSQNSRILRTVSLCRFPSRAICRLENLTTACTSHKDSQEG